MRDKNAVFDAIGRLVSAGEYLDTIPGRPDADLDGGGMFQRVPGNSMRRMYQRGSHQYLEACARGWIEPLPPLRPAPAEAAAEAESLAGRPLPPLLRLAFPWRHWPCLAMQRRFP